MSQQFADKARDIRDSWRRFCLRRIGYAGMYGTALAIEFAITFVLLLPRYRAGELSVGDIVLFNTLLLQLNQPFEMIGHAIDDLVRSYSQFLPFARMWMAAEELEPAEHQSFALKNGVITFEDVGFSYEGGRGIERVTFAVKRGRITFLTGETGSGKSTIFKLALKSVEPGTGRISVDGVDLHDIARVEWFSMIGVVPQEVMLLNATLSTNIVLGRPLDEARLRKAAKKAAILDFVEALPDGFETAVGERGLKLSGGERQRIAIARALYAEPQILFLDEASSALDEATEGDIMTHIRMIADQITVLAITHRKTVIMPDDQIVRLSDGRVVITNA
jgi:ABC-type multidrug transport system fused ATPase/permease subunit